jgi:hypothetical protein
VRRADFLAGLALMVGWPVSNFAEPELLPGPEWTLRKIVVANPGPGTTFTVTVPGEFDWRLLALNMLFGTSVVVGDRVPHLRMRDQTRELVRVPAGAIVPPGASVFVQWVAGLGAVQGSAAQGMLLAPWPALILPAGHTLDWLCTNLDGGDEVQLITLTVLERFTGRRPPESPGRPALVSPLDLGARLAS